MNIGYLVRGRFDSGDWASFTGTGTVSWDGVDYIGTGTVLTIGEAVSSVESGKDGLTITLSGIDPNNLVLAEQEDFQRRRVTIYLAQFDDEGQIVSTDVFFDGLADDMESDDDPQSPTLTLYLEQRALDLSRPRPFKYLPEDQKRRFPGDTFFDLVAALQNREDTWGN